MVPLVITGTARTLAALFLLFVLFLQIQPPASHLLKHGVSPTTGSPVFPQKRSQVLASPRLRSFLPKVTSPAARSAAAPATSRRSLHRPSGIPAVSPLHSSLPHHRRLWPFRDPRSSAYYISPPCVRSAWLWIGDRGPSSWCMVGRASFQDLCILILWTLGLLLIFGPLGFAWLLRLDKFQSV